MTSLQRFSSRRYLTLPSILNGNFEQRYRNNVAATSHSVECDVATTLFLQHRLTFLSQLYGSYRALLDSNVPMTL